MKMTGISGTISAAHYSRDGKLHGHTWMVIVWYHAAKFGTFDAEIKKQLLSEYLERFDHNVIEDKYAWGEELAEKIGMDLRAVQVDVGRPLEGIFAKWIKE